ncbi:MAG: PcfJ domain-containing protein [Dorea sp.]|nr:PcfJ domain-containing protein [Dorea sp.]
MRKEQLRKLRKLYATPAMMKKAGMDVPKLVERKNQWRKEDLYQYKYGIYLRCQVLQGILKVAFFLVEEMRLGLNKPVYELFINKETGEFITWDVKHEKWRNAKVDMLDWPEYTYYSGRYINPEGNRNIKRYLKTEVGGYKGILEYQQNVRKEELKKKYKRETEPWDLEMDKVPDLPKDWIHWVDKHAIRDHFIFYEYSRKGATEGYCTWCERTVPIKNPKHNQYGTCRCCGRKIQYKARGKAGNIWTDRETAYLIQRCEDGFVIRMFRCRKHLQKGNYEHTDVGVEEIRRVIYNKWFYGMAYVWDLYKQDHMRWIGNGKSYYSWYYNYEGAIYKRTLASLAKAELKRTGLAEMAKDVERFDPEEYVEGWKQHPQYEQFAKAGLGQLIIEGMHDRRSTINTCNAIKDLAKSLGIDKARMKRLRENRGGDIYLEWLRREKAMDTIIPDEVIRYFSENQIRPKNLKLMLTRMSERKICNYLKKQKNLTGRRPLELISDWEDYMLIANRLKIDTRIEKNYKPKNLKAAHDEVVSMCGGQDIARRAGEIAEKFPDIDRIHAEIKEKYEYEGKKYSIVVPERIEDIIQEGKILGHCLHSSDRYFDRIQRRETYIVFLRKTAELDKPYYTLEIEPDGATRQKRTVGDNQNADFEEAKSFIRRWQQAIQKRLTEEDIKLAQISRKLRVEEFDELRKGKNKVWHGKLAGKLLVDVLEADLMEVEKAAVS